MGATQASRIHPPTGDDAPGGTALPWHAGMVWSLALLCGTRLVLLSLAPVAEPHKRPHFHDDHVRGYYWHSESRARPFFEVSRNIYLDMWVRSDSWQYLDIARGGYYLEPGEGGYGTVACFPLYPLSVRLVAFLFFGDFLAAALCVSAASAWASSVLLYRVAWSWQGLASARVATIALFAFPSAFFLTTPFPHSMFLALSLVSLIRANDGRIIEAGLAALLAGATRTEGVVLWPAIAAAYWGRYRLEVNRQVIGLVLPPLGLFAYMAYLNWRFGDPLAFVEIQGQFGRALSNPLGTLVRPLLDHVFNLRHFLTYLAAGWLVVLTMRRAAPAILVFGWLLFLLPLSTGRYESIYRIQLTTFPIYLGLAAVPARWVAWLQIAVFAVLQLVTCFWFIAGVRVN